MTYFVWKLWKTFFKCKKLALRNIFWHFFRMNFFMFVLLISNHRVFLIQFKINLNLWVFQKAEIALTKVAHAISAFWKTHSCKLIPNWTRTCMITYTNNIYKITQFWLAECSAVQVWHQCKLHIVILDYDWLKGNRKFTKPTISCTKLMKILCRKFFQMQKNCWERSSGTSSTQVFPCLY